MASRTFRQFAGTLEYGLVTYNGVISIAADATVSSDTIPGATVARTATGQYTITLADTYQSLLSCTLTLEAATAVDLVPQVKSSAVSTTGAIVFVTNTGATPTDAAAVCKVHVHIAVKNSGVTAP